MLNNLILEIENFGLINNSKIEINQINVIGGVNSSGKSISSKLLYSFLMSISPEGNVLAEKSIKDRLNPLIYFYLTVFEDNLEINNKLKSLNNANYEFIYDTLCSIYDDNPDKFENNQIISNSLNTIKNVIDIHKSDDKYSQIMKVLLISEFNLNQIEEHSKISFKQEINGNLCNHDIEFFKNKIKFNFKSINLNSLLFDQIIYVDSLAILDSYKNMLSSSVPFHFQDLLKKLKTKKEIDIYEDEFFRDMDDLKKDLTKIINGRIEFDSNFNEFIYKTENNNYPMSNTASGIKQLGIFQNLLDKNILKNNSFIFIDEPEINLHPKWQIKFAEIICLLANKSNITFYINSHSPIFIEAMEVYSNNCKMENDINFYLTQENNEKFTFSKISRSDLPILYNNLGDPYDIIDEIRAKNLLN